MRLPRPSKERLRRASVFAAVALGPVCAVALLAGLGSHDGGAALLRLGAAALALAVGLRGVLALQRNALEARARGRSLTVGADAPGAGAALTVSVATTLAVLIVSGVIELVALSAAGEDGDAAASEGSLALQEARARRDAGEVAPEAGGGGSSSGVLGPGGARTDVGRTGEGVVGDLLSGAEVLRVRPLDEGARSLMGMVPLHLRGWVYDAFDRAGRFAERSGRRGRVDGGADGWIDLASSDALAGPTPAGLDVALGVELTLDPNGVVFAPTRLTHVRAAGANVDEGVASLVLARADHAAYDVRSTIPRVPLEQLRAANARGSIEGHLDLPKASRGSRRGPALQSLRGLGRTLTRDARTDVDRVLAVVKFLRTEFSYEIYDIDFLSPEDALAFIDRGAGSCTHFASLAALLLRLQGIPTRVAAGYVAREVDGPDGRWVVRKRDGHVWIEVHFDGLGWLPFDPTPGDPEVGGAGAAWSPLADEGRLDGPAGRPPITSPLGRVLVGVVDAAARWVAQPGGGPRLAAVVLLALAALAAAVLRIRAAGRKSARAAAPGDGRGEAASSARPARSTDGAVLLLGALRGRGWRQARTATPTAHARDLERTHPEARGLAGAFRTILRSASTGAETTAHEDQDLREVAERIAAGPAASEEAREA
ncbi:MAG: transglutaminase-like domain-containing protein, partial [Planctomycetota bacterium]